MPRRIPDYPDAYAGWNYVSSFGSYISVFAILIFFVVVYETLTNLESCPVNPWEFSGDVGSKCELTLEWVVGSPPGFHTFDELPLIKDTSMSRIES